MEPATPTDEKKTRQVVSVDYLQTDGKKYQIIVDRHSGFISVFPMTSTTSEAGIEALTDHFLFGGFPRSMRSDGAKNLDSRAVDRFREENGIVKELSLAYFAESNGMACLWLNP